MKKSHKNCEIESQRYSEAAVVVWAASYSLFRPLIISLIFAMHFLGDEKASANCFFDGELIYVRYDISPSNVPAATNSYRISGACSDEQFLANILPIDTEDDAVERFGWDGVALYSVSSWPSEPRRGLPRTNAVGNIEKVFVPRFLTKPSKALAIALAPTPFLVGLTNARDHGLWMYGLEPVPEDKCTYRVVLDPAESSVSEVEAWATNYLIFVPPIPAMRIPAPSPRKYLPEVYTNGYRHWTYRATNFNFDCKRPSSFELTLYFPKTGLNNESTGIAQGDLYVMASIRGTLAFRSSGRTNISYLPEIDHDGLTVWDHRFREDIVQDPIPEGIEGVFQHRLTVRNWRLDTNLIQRRIARLIPAYQNLKNRKQRVNVPTLLTGAAIFLTPLLLLWWRRVKNQQRTTTLTDKRKL